MRRSLAVSYWRLFILFMGLLILSAFDAQGAEWSAGLEGLHREAAEQEADAEPEELSTVRDEGLAAKERSTYALELWLEQSKGRVIRLPIVITDVKSIHGEKGQCKLIAKQDQHFPMPCKEVGTLSRGETLTVVCTFVSWDYTANLPTWKDCRIVTKYR